MKDVKKIELNPIKLFIAFIVLVAVVLLVVSIAPLFHENPFGEQIAIDNFSKYYSDVPDSTKDSVLAALFVIVNSNTAEGSEVQGASAKIRDGSAENNYDKNKDIHSGKFIVDIESMQQSYAGYFEWSKDENNVNLSGYRTLFTCLNEDELIYGDFGCKDMFSDMITTKFPVIKKLPIRVEYYSDNYSIYTYYYIGYELKDDGDLIIKITDYTGGNYENALEKMKAEGVDLEKYTIEYNDESTSLFWGHAG